MAHIPELICRETRDAERQFLYFSGISCWRQENFVLKCFLYESFFSRPQFEY